MYIKKEDFAYLESLGKGFDEAGRKRFMDVLLKSVVKRAGEDVKEIQIVGDEILDVQGIEPGEFVTRTMIKKAFKAAKEAK